MENVPRIILLLGCTCLASYKFCRFPSSFCNFQTTYKLRVIKTQPNYNYDFLYEPHKTTLLSVKPVIPNR